MCSRLIAFVRTRPQMRSETLHMAEFRGRVRKDVSVGSETSMDSLSPAPSVYLGPLVPGAARHRRAPIAQQAERLHGKEKVCGSIPHGGSDSVSGATAHRRNMRPV
jgi:hypothetical protein